MQAAAANSATKAELATVEGKADTNAADIAGLQASSATKAELATVEMTLRDEQMQATLALEQADATNLMTLGDRISQVETES